jgi:hypothetical protein
MLSEPWTGTTPDLALTALENALILVVPAAQHDPERTPAQEAELWRQAADQAALLLKHCERAREDAELKGLMGEKG